VLGMPFEIDNEKKKRHRRQANEIARHYKCPINDCPKSYGSEGSLNQHIKLKHPEYYAEMIQQNNANQSIAELGAAAFMNKSHDDGIINDMESFEDSQMSNEDESDAEDNE
jgi:hypothetical protein